MKYASLGGSDALPEFNLLRGQDLVGKNAYRAGGVVVGDINSILAEEFCADLTAPVIAICGAKQDRIED